MSLAHVIADSTALSSWRARPRSFVALMGLYESNYTRLGWLVEDIRTLDGTSRSAVAGDCDLVLTVTERGPYTATFTLTYDLGEAGGPPPERPATACLAASHETPVTVPDMAVRVYHDARVAEAQGWAPAHDHAALQRLRSGLERELDQRWARNTMLNKWLEYCAERGHRFPRVKAGP
jgi:uncharacterized protein YqiB (DUF1249 family)